MSYLPLDKAEDIWEWFQENTESGKEKFVKDFCAPLPTKDSVIVGKNFDNCRGADVDFYIWFKREDFDYLMNSNEEFEFDDVPSFMIDYMSCTFPSFKNFVETENLDIIEDPDRMRECIEKNDLYEDNYPYGISEHLECLRE